MPERNQKRLSSSILTKTIVLQSLLLISSYQFALDPTPMLRYSTPPRLIFRYGQTNDGSSILFYHNSYADILRLEPLNALGVTAGVTATENQAINPPASEWANVAYVDTTSYSDDYMLVGSTEKCYVVSIAGGGSIQKTLDFAPDTATYMVSLISLRATSYVIIVSQTRFIKRFDIPTQVCSLTIPDTEHGRPIGSIDQSHGNSGYIIVNTSKVGGLKIYDHTSASTTAVQTFFPVIPSATIYQMIFSETLVTRTVLTTNSDIIYFIDIDQATGAFSNQQELTICPGTTFIISSVQIPGTTKWVIHCSIEQKLKFFDESNHADIQVSASTFRHMTFFFQFVNNHRILARSIRNEDTTDWEIEFFDTTFLFPCPSSCQGCDLVISPTTCTGCPGPADLTKVKLVAGQCQKCSSNSEFLDTISQTCQACDPSCLGCKPTGECLACNDPTHGFSSTTKVCQTCPQNCKICSSSTQCLECKEDSFTILQGGCYDCSDSNTGTKSTECDTIVSIEPELLGVNEMNQEFEVEIKFKGPVLSHSEITNIFLKKLILVESDFEMEVVQVYGSKSIGFKIMFEDQDKQLLTTKFIVKKEQEILGGKTLQKDEKQIQVPISTGLYSAQALQKEADSYMKASSVIFSVLGSIFGPNVLGILIKFFQIVEILEALSYLNADLGQLVKIINAYFNSIEIPSIVPDTFLYSNPKELSEKMRVKSDKMISENIENIFILSKRSDHSLIYIFVWIIYILGYCLNWFNCPKLQIYCQTVLNTIFGISIFDLTFTAMLEISQSRATLRGENTFATLSLITSVIVLFFLMLNLAVLFFRASDIRKRIVITSYRNKKTLAITNQVSNMTKSDISIFLTVFGTIKEEIIPRRFFPCYFNLISMARYFAFQVVILTFQIMNMWQCGMLTAMQIVFVLMLFGETYQGHFFSSNLEFMKLVIFEICLTLFLIIANLLAYETNYRTIASTYGIKVLWYIQTVEAVLILICFFTECIYIFICTFIWVASLIVYFFKRMRKGRQIAKVKPDLGKDSEFYEVVVRQKFTFRIKKEEKLDLKEKKYGNNSKEKGKLGQEKEKLEKMIKSKQLFKMGLNLKGIQTNIKNGKAIKKKLRLKRMAHGGNKSPNRRVLNLPKSKKIEVFKSH